MGKQEDKEGVGVECLERGKFVTGMMNLVERGGSSNRREVKRRCKMKPRSGPESLKTSRVTTLTTSRAQHFTPQNCLTV
jgi:hypothetical protein